MSLPSPPAILSSKPGTASQASEMAAMSYTPRMYRYCLNVLPPQFHPRRSAVGQYAALANWVYGAYAESCDCESGVTDRRSRGRTGYGTAPTPVIYNRVQSER